MKKETIEIVLLITCALSVCVLMPTYPVAGLLVVGILMLWGSRWSRKKSAEFKKTIVDQEQRNMLDDKPILEQLKSKETWSRVKDGLTYHDPKSNKAKAIKHDVIGTLGRVPFTIVTFLLIGIIALIMYLGI